MFQNLGMVEIGSTSREIVREAIKFFRDAAQYLLLIRLAAATGGPTQQLLGDAIITAIKRTQGPKPSPPPSISLRKLADMQATPHDPVVTPAQAGVLGSIRSSEPLDTRFRGHDETEGSHTLTFATRY